ncbi:hypothetical protein ACRALDRAFT_1069786 [Sodiomyces alcalophilus JCM 7366]|uniref:uncharacterized protein n=1 Tax=Sodiomyces alcalophilus JCM 7366 TaxID=591952 RepID=UPI0039B50533
MSKTNTLMNVMICGKVRSGGWRDAEYRHEPGRGPNKGLITKFVDKIEYLAIYPTRLYPLPKTIASASATKRTIIEVDDYKEQLIPSKKGKGSNKLKSPAIILVDVLADNEEDKDEEDKDDKEEDMVMDNN